ncbi:uncharacterized protein LOC107269000 isoform X2 [Cephus cinctus]|uniref:Uncharacterized protein LOC107269000 isoform X2 n=1 Tax=Cephus cinctus TaxID=211228 RepID=A0AAJ7W2F4_CEPCN|nr:uncharacterized protein LOC107269000 isoform X2 [Cephus cinctus]
MEFHKINSSIIYSDMCDSFEMACHDDTSALRLNIKVNSENLLPTPQKFTVGSLRLPADPSWPKIPRRKLADDVGDIIEPPCVVALTGTPRKSRTIVRPHSQSTRVNNLEESLHRPQKIPTLMHQQKRRPGCLDPRFKRVTSVKSQMTSTDPSERDNEKPTELSRSALVIPSQSKSMTEKIEKTVPEKDTNTPQVTQREAEKPGEIKGMESIGIQTCCNLIDGIDIKVQSEANEMVKDIRNSNDIKILEHSSPRKDYYSEKLETKLIDPQIPRHDRNTINLIENDNSKVSQKEDKLYREVKNNDQLECIVVPKDNGISNSKTVQNVSSTLISSDAPQQYSQGKNGQFLLMVEKKVQPTSASNMQLGFSSVPNCQYMTQCYNVQVPVLSYQNVPVQISTQSQAKVDIPPKSLQTASSLPLNQKLNNIDNTEENVSCQSFSYDPEVSGDLHFQTAENNKLSTEMAKYEVETADSELCSPDTPKGQIRKSAFKECKLNESNKNALDQETTDSEVYTQHNEKHKTPSRDNHVGPTKRQQLLSHSEMQCGQIRKTAAAHLKKASSYVTKSEEPLIADSDSNIVCPGYHQCSKRKHTNHYLQKMVDENKELSHNMEKAIKTVDTSCITRNVKRICCGKEYQRSMHDAKRTQEIEGYEKQHIEQDKLPRTSLDMPFEQSTAIPAKTQELLNKSYWDYYNKLKSHKLNNGETAEQQYFCQIAMGAPQIKKRKAEDLDCQSCEEQLAISSPEIRTLEQCSVLSSMINKTLDSTLQHSTDTIQTKQLYINGNMKSSSDPTAGTHSAVIKKITSGEPNDFYEESLLSSSFLNKFEHKREKYMDKRLLKLKTIIFFGCMMYAIIVFLPMIYDYFFYDEYDTYEDLSYVELTLDYVLSSFKEAFGGFFDSMNKIFLRPFFVISSISVGSATTLANIIASIFLPRRL